MAKKYYLKLRSTPYLSGMILLSIEEIEGICSLFTKFTSLFTIEITS